MLVTSSAAATNLRSTQEALPSTLSVIVVLPTYNEVENITTMLEAILGSRQGIEVLVVDDSSPDGTGRAAALCGLDHPGRVHLLERPKKDGLGGAYRAGFAWALDRGYEVIVQMDADGSHPVHRLPALLQTLERGMADIAIGSRYVRGGGTQNWPLRRKLLSRSANRYARSVLGLAQRDVTGGFRAWRRDALLAVDPARTTTSGYGLLVEMAMLAQARTLRIAELPITFVDRVHGDSKMDGAIALEGLRMVLRLRRRGVAAATAPTSSVS